MPIYSEIYQERADKLAKRYGYSGTKNIGPGEWIVHSDSINAESALLFKPILKDNCKIGVYHHIIVTATQITLFRGEPTDFYIAHRRKNRSIIVISPYNIVALDYYKIGKNRRLINTDRLQMIADNWARRNGYYAAGFIGSYYGYTVYCLFDSISIPYPTGAPDFLLVNKKGQTQQVCNFEEEYMGSFHIMHNLIPYSSHTRGRTIYSNLMKQLETGNYDENEKEYLEYLKNLDLFHWRNKRLSRSKVYDWLEVANRIGEKIIIVDNPEGVPEKFIAFREPYYKLKEKWKNEDSR